MDWTLTTAYYSSNIRDGSQMRLSGAYTWRLVRYDHGAVVPRVLDG